MDRLCPKCGQRYRADVAICPVHRVALVEDPFIGRSLGEFDIVGFLGSGAMGVVYRAEPPSAIKILNVVRARMQPELVRRFELEAKAIARLESPHVVRLYDAGTTGDGHLYITMELLRGQTLDDLIRARRTLGPERSADIVFQAASALGEAHDKWVVHRDVKPDNLYLESGEGGRDFVRVLDFGVVRINSDSVARSITGTVAGTPAYMSPEQLKSEKDIDGRTDIYSLGVVLYQGLAGRNPFQGEGLMQTIQRHLYEPVPPLPAEVPPALAELTLRMLAKAREDRPQTMAEVQHALIEMGLAPDPPVRLAGPVGDHLAPEAPERRWAALETDPAFQRARQITPVARPVDPPSLDTDGPDGLDGFDAPAPPAPAPATLDPADDPFALSESALPESALPGARRPGPRGSHIEPLQPRDRAAERRPTDRRPAAQRSAERGRDDPWRNTAPPADRPSIDIPAARLPAAPAAPPTTAPSTAPPAEAPVDPALRTWVDVDGELDLPPEPPQPRRRLWATGLVFVLGVGTGVGLTAHFAGQASDPRPTIEAPAAGELARRARAALESEQWTTALAAAEQLTRLRPDDTVARRLRETAAAEAAAAQTFAELLERIADEQWTAARARATAFPPTSVYGPRAQALLPLIDEGVAADRLEEGLTRALHGQWAAAAEVHDALAATAQPPAQIALLEGALRRKRFKPTPATEHRLEARRRMQAGEYRLAITRLRQAAADLGQPDKRISRRLCAAHRALGEFDAAREHAQAWRTLERDPRYAPVVAHIVDRLDARLTR